MQLHKTHRARAELQSGVRTLGQRERTLLLLADGNRSARDFRPLFNGGGEEMALRLLSEGFLEIQPASTTAPELTPPPVTATPHLAARLATVVTTRLTPSPEPAQPALTMRSPEPQQTSADQFDGKRSLATTRMFLFDICERMFARRNPEMAERFREALRNAKDRKTMLATSRQMLDHIETAAGYERADSISERIAMLLPDTSVADTAV